MKSSVAYWTMMVVGISLMSQSSWSSWALYTGLTLMTLSGLLLLTPHEAPQPSSTDSSTSGGGTSSPSFQDASSFSRLAHTGPFTNASNSPSHQSIEFSLPDEGADSMVAASATSPGQLDGSSSFANMWAPKHPDETVAEDITRDFFLRAGYKDLCYESYKSPFGSRLYYRITTNGQRRALRVVLADSGFALPTGPIHRMSLRELRRLMPRGVVIYMRPSSGEGHAAKKWRVPWEHVSRIYVVWTISLGECNYYPLDEDGRPVGRAIEMWLPSPAAVTPVSDTQSPSVDPQEFLLKRSVKTMLGPVLFYKTHDAGRLGDHLTAIHFTGKRGLKKLNGTKWNRIHGIDGAYLRTRKGQVVEVLVVENKINRSSYSRRQLSVTTIRKQCEKLLASRHAKKREAGRIILQHLDARSSPGRFVAEIVRHNLRTGYSYRREVDEDGRPIGKRRKWNNRFHVEYWLRRRIDDGQCELCEPT